MISIGAFYIPIGERCVTPCVLVPELTCVFYYKILLKITYPLKLNLNTLELHTYKTHKLDKLKP